MKYADSPAFRRALEDRLRAQSLKTGAPLVRLRKMVAFDRLLARLIAVQADAWVLKGGLALQPPRLSGENSRVKDLVDILLMAELGQMRGLLLRRALQATFSVRNTHVLPDRLSDPPEGWEAPYLRLANEQNLNFATLPEAGQAANDFIEPVLQSADSGSWDPLMWAWH